MISPWLRPWRPLPPPQGRIEVLLHLGIPFGRFWSDRGCNQTEVPSYTRKSSKIPPHGFIGKQPVSSMYRDFWRKELHRPLLKCGEKGGEKQYNDGSQRRLAVRFAACGAELVCQIAVTWDPQNLMLFMFSTFLTRRKHQEMTSWSLCNGIFFSRPLPSHVFSFSRGLRKGIHIKKSSGMIHAL